MRLPIHLQREIVRLHFQDTDRANREIARSVGVSPNTVAEVRTHVRNAEIAWEKMLGAGVVPGTVESVLLELLRTAEAPEFKTVQRLIR